ncbi:MAG: rhamnulokinase [Clostridiales bacterium]|nr:rhamnulokinase [Clostridiales bacterium]
MNYYLAIDIGASSGRHIVGHEENGELVTDEVYRFLNGVKRRNGHLVWNVKTLFSEVVKGIKKSFKKYPEIRSIAIDTWGVDYVLFKGDVELSPCYAYRDRRTESVIDSVHGIVPFEELYKRTGIQFQPFNTIYQLYDDLRSGRLDNVTDFLMVPEYLSYMLTGVKKKEYTNATTTGLLNAATGEFDGEIIKKLGMPKAVFDMPLCAPGTVVGKLKNDIAEEVGGQAEVVLCASHDTASAVEGIPMAGDELYISSGTWSLLGVKLDKPLCDDGSRMANYTNEGGVGYIRYQKNIMGMWVVNELKKELCPDKTFSDIVAEAERSDFALTVDVNADCFLSPKSMKAAFYNALSVKPKTVGDYFNCAYNSLAQSYKRAIEELESNVGKTYEKLYIVGGGAKNEYLNRLTKEATCKEVVALPIEATALGNLKIQSER